MLWSSLNKKVTAIKRHSDFSYILHLVCAITTPTDTCSASFSLEYTLIVCWHTPYMLPLVFTKTKRSGLQFLLVLAIMSPGRWSRSGWGSGRRLLPGTGSCRQSTRPPPAAPATGRTLRDGNANLYTAPFLSREAEWAGRDGQHNHLFIVHSMTSEAGGQ